MKPAALILVLMFAVLALAAGAFAITQTQTLTDTQQDLEAAVTNATAQAAALEGLITQSAATSAAIAQAAETEMDGMRGAAATLQAGSLATRSALQATLSSARERATQVSQENMTAAAAAQSEQEALEATVAAQADALIQSQATLDAAATQAELQAQLIVTAQAQSGELEDSVAGLQTQVAQLEAQVSAAVAESAEAGTDVQPLSQVSVSSLIFTEAFDAESQFPTQVYPGIGETSLEDGQLVVDFLEQPSEPAITILSNTSLDDGLIEVQFTVETCPEDGLLLVELRGSADSTGGYAAGVDCGYRSWGVFRRSGQDVTLLDSSPVDPVVENITTPHIIGVEMRGATVTLYLDGLLQGRVEDTTYDDGVFGITVVSPGTATVRADNLRVWSIAEMQAVAATPSPEVVAYDSRVERSNFLTNLPEAFDAGRWTWQRVGDPRLGFSELETSTLSLQLRENDGARAFVTLLFSSDQELLSSTAEGATQELQIQAFAAQPDDFPEPGVFGQSSDGFEAVWTEDGRLFRITLIDVDQSSEEMLLALSRAVRELASS